MQELSIYAPALPEIVLALGAMAILMFGVFKNCLLYTSPSPRDRS